MPEHSHGPRSNAKSMSEILNLERLGRFSPVIDLNADIARHSLGWRMAVLPFRSIGAPLGEGLALGLAEEISTSLSRFRAPRLIATATFWDGTGPVQNAMERCRAYQLDYLVDGTIQVIDNHVRVNVTLLDVVLDSELIWSSRFEGSLDDLSSLQDRIASATVAQIDPELFYRMPAFTSLRTEVAAAHRAVLIAIQGIYRLDRTEFMRARDLLSEAIDLDPDCAQAHAWLAYWAIMAAAQGWADQPRSVTELAGQSAERAVLLDPLDARALAIAGHVKAFLQHDVRSALTLHARAIELNPNLPIAWTLSSWSKIYSGNHAMAVRHALTSQALSPQDPHIFAVEHVLMTANFFRRHLDEAERMAKAALQRNPDHTSALNVYIAILGHMDRVEEAGHLLQLLRAAHPAITVDGIAARVPLLPEDMDFYKDGLRRGGVPG